MLDAGFCNFLVPFVENVEQARRAVAATRYPPQGVRGVSVAQRSNRYGTVPDYFKSVNDEGATFVAVGSDLSLFRLATQALCDRYRSPGAA